MVGLMRFGDLVYMANLQKSTDFPKKIPSPELLDYLRRSLDVITATLQASRAKVIRL